MREHALMSSILEDLVSRSEHWPCLEALMPTAEISWPPDIGAHNLRVLRQQTGRTLYENLEAMLPERPDLLVVANLGCCTSTNSLLP